MSLTVLMVLVIVVTNAAGDICITRGMKRVGEIDGFRPGQLLKIVKRVLTCGDFLLGILFLAMSFFSFLAILSWADMSFVVPATSLVYVVALIGARFLLKERVDGLRWAGTIIVCVGVALICLP